MEEKTPNFNAKIKKILENTPPGFRICQETGDKFEIRKEDIEFYKKMAVPAPISAPWARMRRMYVYISPDELFKRKSGFSGKEIITNVDPQSPAIVYANDEWWSDKWDASSHGISYSPLKSFFEQLYDLRKRVPRPEKMQNPNNVNSEWVIGGANLKNCYMVYGGTDNENVMYSIAVTKCRDAMEIYFSEECELGYSLFECKRCYQSAYLENSEDCINCYFGFDLKNCENCFGCVNLQHKKYCFFNIQLTEEEYEKKLQGIDLGSRKEVAEWAEKFKEFREKNAIQLNLRLKGAENSVGDNLTDCKNCYMCFNTSNAQDSAYLFFSRNTRDTFDALGTGVEHSIEVVGRDSYNAKYCNDLIYYSNNVEYCELCFSVENCFGCIGLRNKKYHILNKPYSEDEYWKLVDKIKCEMLERGEYGQGSPLKYSIYPYNLTVATYIFPMTEKEAERLGVRLYKYEVNKSSQGMDAAELPDNIKNAKSDIVIGKPLVCTETKRLFSIIKQEFDFYKNMNLPLPTIHPRARRLKQYAKVMAPKLIKNPCAKCGKEILIRGLTGEAPRVKNVCNDCYLVARQ